MLGTLVFIFSSGGARVFRLIFGNIVATRFGHAEYAVLVQALAKANVLVSISTVSYVQLILSSARHHASRYGLQAFIFTALASLTGGLIAARHSLMVGAFVAAFAFGNSVLSIAVSQLNGDLKNGHAGRMMLVGSLLPYVLAGAAIFAGARYPLVMIGHALAFSCLAAWLFFDLNKATLRGLTLKKIPALIVDSIPLKRDHVLLMIYIGTSLFSHSRILTHVGLANGKEQTAAFMLGYQLFMIGFFVPRNLGNVMIPRLSRESASKRTLGKHVLVYSAIAVGWLITVALLCEYILAAYHLPATEKNVWTVIALQASVIPASLNALLSQRLAATKRFTLLAALWIVFAAILFTWCAQVGYEPVATATGFAASYVIILGLYATVFSSGRANVFRRLRTADLG